MSASAPAAPAAATSPAQAFVRRRATLIGFSAVLMWALLALLTASSGAVPPFQLLAMTFAIATIVGAAASARHGRLLDHLRQPWPVWALGVGGLFGHHVFYFLALRNAQAVEACLFAYLWPLLLVVFSALRPGGRLRWFDVR